MSIEQRYDKVIVHNYGHGGSGWTLGPGSADYTNNLLITSECATSLKKDTPIVIVGAGVMGLFSAYDLLIKGYKNITIVAENFDSTTSHNSGGLIAPVSMDNDSKLEEVVFKVGFKSYKFYKTIIEKSLPHFEGCAFILPAYFENRKDSGLEPYVGVVMKLAKDVILDFGNGTRKQMVVYDDAIFIDVVNMLSALKKHLKKNDVKFVKKKIREFSQLSEKFIINCTGMGGKVLCADDKMVSVQGHLIMLKNQNLADLQYMLLVYLDTGTTKSGQKVRRSFYVVKWDRVNTLAFRRTLEYYKFYGIPSWLT